MHPKPPAGKPPVGFSSGDAVLLDDLKTLSKALSINLTPSHSISSSSSSSSSKTHPNPKKKQSFWHKWKNLRSLSTSRNRSSNSFDCIFSLHVHSVTDLPALFAGSSILVSWKRTADPTSIFSTRAARVFGSSVAFDEVLTHRCQVSGTRSVHFLVWVSVEGSPRTDLGRNLVDLARLLKSNGKWSTKFKLSGKGKGAEISISFGFALAGDGSGVTIKRSQSDKNVKVLHEVTVVTEDEEKEYEEPEFKVVDKGIEIVRKDSTFEPNMRRVVFDIGSPDIEAKNCHSKPRSKSLSLDDEMVANEFLNMLGIDRISFESSSGSNPESPRERLWKQFEKESLNDDSIFSPDTDFAEDFDLSAILHEAENEFIKSRAKLIEDAENEVLMRQYGFAEKAFQGSSFSEQTGFGSPIDLPPEEPLELPPLCEGFGPFVKTKDGGLLRSMSPSLFKNANYNGQLIMQVSTPVVLPAQMGSGVAKILLALASLGIEKLSLQVKNLMPLEDITGKTMRQIALNVSPALEASERHNQKAVRDRPRGRSPNRTSSRAAEQASEYVPVEDLVPVATDKIEALLVEGLRIQSGMSDEEAPSNIETNEDELEALLGLSINLDEWITKDRFSKNFMVTLMTQLRDPLRNYEPVGSPMLSLIQVERAFVPRKPKSYWTVFEKQNSKELDETETDTKFKITDVHVAGVNGEAGKKKPWDNSVHEQSGSRWLLATGMGKRNKHPFMKTKAFSRSLTAKVQPGETLWSISSRGMWDELSALNTPIRNPNAVFPNKARLR